MKFFDSNPSGRIINRLSTDVLVIDEDLPWYANVALEKLINCLAFPIGIALIFPWMGLVIVLGIFMMIYVLNLYRPSNRELKRLSSVNDGKLLNMIGEVCRGSHVIRAFEN